MSPRQNTTRTKDANQIGRLSDTRASPRGLERGVEQRVGAHVLLPVTADAGLKLGGGATSVGLVTVVAAGAGHRTAINASPAASGASRSVHTRKSASPNHPAVSSIRAFTRDTKSAGTSGGGMDARTDVTSAWSSSGVMSVHSFVIWHLAFGIYGLSSMRDASSGFSFWRARKIRDSTVPIGTSRAAAISL